MQRITCQRLKDRIRKMNNRLKAAISLEADYKLRVPVSPASADNLVLQVVLEQAEASVIVAAREVIEEYYRALEQVVEDGYPTNWEDWEYYKEQANGHLRRLGVAA